MTGRSIVLEISLTLFVKLRVNTLNYGVPLHDRSFSCSPFLYLAWMLYVFCRLSASRFCFSSLMVVFYNSQVQYIIPCKNLEQFFLFPFVQNNIFPSTNDIQAFFLSTIEMKLFYRIYLLIFQRKFSSLTHHNVSYVRGI